MKGAVHVTVAWPLPATATATATATTDVGAPGTEVGVAGAEGDEAAPVPSVLVAVTVNVYDIPLVKPSDTQDVAPEDVHTAPDQLVTV